MSYTFVNSKFINYCKHGELNKAQKILKTVYNKTENCEAGILVASKAGKLNIVKWLLPLIENSCCLAFMNACERNHLATAQFLFEFITLNINIIGVEHVNLYFYTAFRNACIYGRFEIVHLLLSKRLDINAVIADYENIYELIKHGNLNIIKRIYEIYPDFIVENYFNIFMNAIDNSKYVIAEWVINTISVDLYTYNRCCFLSSYWFTNTVYENVVKPYLFKIHPFRFFANSIWSYSIYPVWENEKNEYETNEKNLNTLCILYLLKYKKYNNLFYVV